MCGIAFFSGVLLSSSDGGRGVCVPPEPKCTLWVDWHCILGQLSEASAACLIMEWKLNSSAAVYRSLGGPVLRSTGTFPFWKDFCSPKDGLWWSEIVLLPLDVIYCKS